MVRAVQLRAPDLQLEYVVEPDVSDALDAELRQLLSTCFEGAHNAFFRERRYANEMPKHRWMLRDRAGTLAAHIAAHDKIISVNGNELRVVGIAEVCVAAPYRGRGLVRYLLDLVHAHFAEQRVSFSVLFGEVDVYASSGYRQLTMPLRYFDAKNQRWETAANRWAMWRSLDGTTWPDGEVDLRGPTF